MPRIFSPIFYGLVTYIFYLSTNTSLFSAESKPLRCSPLSCSDSRLALECLRPDYIKVITSKKFKKKSQEALDHKGLSLEYYMSTYPTKKWHSSLLCLKSFCLFGCNTDDCNKSESLVQYCHLMCEPKHLKQCSKNPSF